MNLNHLTDDQRQAVREGRMDWTGWALCGTSVSRRVGECRCDSCQMPVTLNNQGHWVYA